MRKAWKSYKYKLHSYFKSNGGENDLVMAKKKRYPDFRGDQQEDWEILCDRWSTVQFKEHMLEIKGAYSPEEMSDKEILESVLGRQSIKVFKHHILHLGTNKTVCTDCVIYLHAPSLCPVCFTVHENPEKLITSNVVVSCLRCYSSSHVNCIGSHPHAPYLCVMCLNHNSPLLVLGDSNGGKTVDKNAAKIFLAACKISAGSMKKGAVTAKMEMEARAKEAIDARELAIKAIEHVEHLRRNSAST
ncbi:hypothetical protein AgCh_016385 [Apium graveolens]